MNISPLKALKQTEINERNKSNRIEYDHHEMVMKKKERNEHNHHEMVMTNNKNRNDKKKAPRVGDRHTNQKKRQRGCLTSVKE